MHERRDQQQPGWRDGVHLTRAELGALPADHQEQYRRNSRFGSREEIEANAPPAVRDRLLALWDQARDDALARIARQERREAS